MSFPHALNFIVPETAQARETVSKESTPNSEEERVETGPENNDETKEAETGKTSNEQFQISEILTQMEAFHHEKSSSLNSS